MTQDTASTQLAVDIKGLSKTYDNNVKALDDVSLQITAGDFFALLGPNGAGKSTAIGVLCSLVNKTAGQVKIFGIDIDKDFTAAKRLIGVVPQEFNFNQFEKVQDVVLTQAGFYGLSKADRLSRTERYLKALDLWDKRDKVSRTLSGGMKRRLMIARALVHEPRLLILDEPTAGVDIELRRSMWDYLTQLNNSGTTIILTTHYLEEAENLCRNIAIIDQGNIVENTSMLAFLNQLDHQTYELELQVPLESPLPPSAFQITPSNNHTLTVSLTKGQLINDLFSWLTEKGITISSLKNTSNRIETLFVAKTRN